jgi:signal recognition particle subunit SRP54
MFDFLGKRLQKSLAKIKSKRKLNENDILQAIREIKMSFLEADVNVFVVKKFIKIIKEKLIDLEIIDKLTPYQQVVKIVQEELIDVLGKEKQKISIKGKPEIILMIGLQGSGKTTSSVKIAKYLMKKENIKKPLLVAADVYRPAAIEQLVKLGKELRIDVFFKNKQKNPINIVKEAYKKAHDEKYDLLLIDTAGRLAINKELMQELDDIKKIVKPNEIIFVVDALSGQDIINVAQIFNDKLKITGLLITKLDSDARGGAALSIRQILDIPILFIGTGEKTNEIDLFHPDRMAKRILGMGDVLSLIEKAKEVVDEKKSQKLMNRMISGKFDLNDLMEQLKQIKKFGKMSKLLKMIPGINNKISQIQINSTEEKFYLFEILISSMTKEEKQNPKLLKNSKRKTRILLGSGRKPQEYNKLINEFEKMSKQMKEISKKIKTGNLNGGFF